MAVCRGRIMKVELTRLNDAVLFEARNDTGATIRIDGSDEVGGVNGGLRPMQTLLAALAGCATIDIVGILKKQKQRIDDLRIVVTGEREHGKTPAVFTSIHLVYEFRGDLETSKVERALELGIRKYCSVGAMLEKSATITYSYTIQ